MPDSTLTEIYRAGDVAAAAYLQVMLEERGLPVFQQDAGVDGLPQACTGTVGHRIMIQRSDAEAHAAEIAEVLREFEATMGLGAPG